jgi:signal transduction histidine kinase
VIFRILGWAWMALLVAITLVSDNGSDVGITLGSLAVVTAWTGATLYAAQAHERLSSSAFVIADGLVAIGALASSAVAGAENMFSGGYPMSWLGVAAYAWGMRGAVAGSTVLAVEQAIVEFQADKGAVPIAGSVTFIVFAVVAGWGYSAVRRADRARLDARAKLAAEQQERARFEERARLANRLHDSVLQTLVAIRREPGDERQVRYLARRQERELRSTIDAYRSPYEDSLRAALLAASGEIEDLYKLEVDVVVRGDAPAGDHFGVVVSAVREALINAAKHSGCEDIDVYALLARSRAEVYVRDRGKGFDLSSVSASGLEHSLIGPIRDAGGDVRVQSSPGGGTEIVIVMETSNEGA